MLRRRPLLAVFFSLLLLTFLAAAIFILTFDLNRYREEVQARLATAIGRPITLGEAHLSLRHGLAFTFSAIAVPATTNASWSLEAGSLLTKLKIDTLLRGKVEFSEIVLLSPRLRLLLREDLPPALTQIPEWEGIGIRALTIRNGSITVEDRRETTLPLNLKVENLHLRLLDFAAGRRAWLTLAGQIEQNGMPGELNVAGEIVPAADLRQSAMNLALKLERLDATVLSPHLPPLGGLTGSLSAALNLTGSLAAGLKIAGEVNGEKLTAAIPDWYAEPLAIGKLRLAGAWAREAGAHRLTGFTLDIDDLAASGDLLWKRDNEQLWLEGTLTTPVQPIGELARLLPDRGPAAALKGRLAEGTWQIENLHYAGPAKDLGSQENLPLQGKFNVRNLRWRGADKRLGAVSFAALFENGLLQLDGTASFLGAPLRFAGTVEHPFGPQRQITAEIEGILSADRLLAELPAARDRKFTAAGQFPVVGTVEGDPENMKFALDSRISNISIGWGDGPGQSAPLAGTLSLAGTIKPDRLEFDRARLQTLSIDLRGKGKFEREGKRRFSLALEFTGLDLEKLRPHLSLIDKIEGKGFLDGNCELAGADGRIDSRAGTVRLRDVGMRLTPAIAPLTGIDGRLRLNAGRVDIEQATAHLGNSPISITGSLSGTDALKADLHVRGKSIRADELIFSSSQLLRDVDGKLHIDRHGIAFAPATVRLDGGTEASVRGNVIFAPPAVDLDIEAARGNIDEVIALWQKPSAQESAEKMPPAAAEGEHRGDGVKVRIGARVGEGTLGELHFRQAEGEISYQHNLLEIFPLRFQVGPGNCLGRVAVEFGAGAPLLKTSGHLENVDAAAVYQQLLKRRGLITGTLHGDFYLEGRVGSEFLKTSSGGFNLETRDGVLRKFPILGKIFSLLNVSQILTLQLPDMVKDGMPFQRLAGNFAMREGILSTEDLFLESPAMNLSLVGELNLPAEKIDLVMGIKPLRTVDRIVTNIPLAGWILAGEEKALITVHFHIHGHPDRAEVDAVPITSLSEKVFGIFRRVLNLPGKMIDDVGGLVREKEK